MLIALCETPTKNMFHELKVQDSSFPRGLFDSNGGHSRMLLLGFHFFGRIPEAKKQQEDNYKFVIKNSAESRFITYHQMVLCTLYVRVCVCVCVCVCLRVCVRVCVCVCA